METYFGEVHCVHSSILFLSCSIFYLSSDFQFCDYTIPYILCRHAKLIKMFGSYVNAAIEPADCPSIKADAVEYFFVAQGGQRVYTSQ